MTGHIVAPQVIQAGDIVASMKHEVTVTHIEGPDYAGVYDFHGINELGEAQIVTAQEFVKLLK